MLNVPFSGKQVIWDESNYEMKTFVASDQIGCYKQEKYTKSG